MQPDERQADPDRQKLSQRLIAARLALPDRLERAVQLQSVLRVWLVGRKEKRIGAYWPIKGEFDPLPALYRWSETDDERRIGLPVVDRATNTLRFHVWYPGCPMENDAYDIPKPKDTEVFEPQLLLLTCVGYGPEGVRLGYGGGFVDRTLRALEPRPYTVGLSYAQGFLPLLRPAEGEPTLDAVITDEGVVWQRD